jgi:hypothetical protein
MVTRAELIDAWLAGKMPVGDETRKDFILRTSKLYPETALITVDWIWNAGFDAGQEQAREELK